VLRKQAKKEPDDAIQASVKKEMARPRMAKSARIAQRKLETGRISELPGTILPGTADKTISSRTGRKPEKAKIGVDGAARRYRNLRIENTLTDEIAIK